MKIPSQDTQKVFAACSWAALSRPDVLWATYYACRQLIDLDVAGDFVECGVFAGAHIAMMARAILDGEGLGSNRKVHLFDSFQGIPNLSDQDEGIIFSNLQKGTTCALVHVKKYLEDWRIPGSLLVYHEGWYDNTLPLLGEAFPPIALLRIDCDLYNSVKLVLHYLYPFLAPLGICVLDDYSFPGARLGFSEGIDPRAISPIAWHRR